MQKDMRVEETVAFAEKCRKYDIKVSFSLLCGLPWDRDYKKTEILTDKEIKHTLGMTDKLIRKNSRNRIILSSYTPYPGSPLYTRCLEIGLKPPDHLEEWATWIEQVSTTPWINPAQTKKFEMLNYLFFFLNSESSEWLSSLIRNRILRFLFKGAFKLFGLIPRLRWRFQFFALPLDCRLYQYIKDKQGVV